MADIFTPWQLGGLSVANRLVRSATWDGMAQPDGTASIETVNLSADLAAGGVGLVISGHTYVHPRGQAHSGQCGVHIDAMVGPLTRISDAVHKSGGLIALQITHSGGQTSAKLIGAPPVGPTAMVHPASKEQLAELSKEQIREIVGCFARAAARAKAAEFDAVQLHMAHGYLINQFLSPNTNQRSDEYGGSPEKRARFALEVYQAVRNAVGPRFPVMVKLNSEDTLEGGLVLEDSLLVAAKLSQMGLDAIEVSGGVPAAGKLGSARAVKAPEDEGYFLANAVAIKAAVKCPVMVVGGWRSKARVEAALDKVDAVAMSRPFVREPDLANRWHSGQSDSARCISCGGCFKTAFEGSLACAQELKERQAKG